MSTTRERYAPHPQGPADDVDETDDWEAEEQRLSALRQRVAARVVQELPPHDTGSLPPQKTPPAGSPAAYVPHPRDMALKGMAEGREVVPVEYAEGVRPKPQYHAPQPRWSAPFVEHAVRVPAGGVVTGVVAVCCGRCHATYGASFMPVAKAPYIFREEGWRQDRTYGWLCRACVIGDEG
ncbi:MAG: hypothetical protein AB7I13_10580 [Vicinamibacterales bacterium]